MTRLLRGVFVTVVFVLHFYSGGLWSVFIFTGRGEKRSFYLHHCPSTHSRTHSEAHIRAPSAMQDAGGHILGSRPPHHHGARPCSAHSVTSSASQGTRGAHRTCTSNMGTDYSPLRLLLTIFLFIQHDVCLINSIFTKRKAAHSTRVFWLFNGAN